MPKSSYESLHLPTNILQATRHRENLYPAPIYILDPHRQPLLRKPRTLRSTVGRRLQASLSTSELVISNSSRLFSSTASLLNLATGHSTQRCSRSSRTLSKLSVAACASLETRHRVHTRGRLQQWTEAALSLPTMAQRKCNVPHRRTQAWYADFNTCTTGRLTFHAAQMIRMGRKNNLNTAQGPILLYRRGQQQPISTYPGHPVITRRSDPLGWKISIMVMRLACQQRIIDTARSICLSSQTGTMISLGGSVAIIILYQDTVICHQVPWTSESLMVRSQ